MIRLINGDIRLDRDKYELNVTAMDDGRCCCENGKCPDVRYWPLKTTLFKYCLFFIKTNNSNCFWRNSWHFFTFDFWRGDRRDPQRGPQHTSTAVVVVFITDVNDNKPVFKDCSSYAPKIEEGAPNGSPVIKVHAEDEDKGVNGQVSRIIEKSFYVNWMIFSLLYANVKICSFQFLPF